MANLDVNKIRNVAVIAHGGAGKTSLTEAMLLIQVLLTGSAELKKAIQRLTANLKKYQEK